MSSAVSLALLSVNLVGLALVTYCANSATGIGFAIRTGLHQGSPLSREDRLMLLHAAWFGSLATQFVVGVIMLLFNLEIANQTLSDVTSALAHISMLIWGMVAFSIVALGTNEALYLRKRVMQDADPPNDSAG